MRKSQIFVLFDWASCSETECAFCIQKKIAFMVLDMSHKESDNIQNMDFLLNHMNAQSGFYVH